MRRLNEYRKALAEFYNRIVLEESNLSIITLVLLVLIVIVPTLLSGKYGNPDFLDNVLGEANGMVLDLLVFGVLVSWFSRIGERRREIQHYLNEIDDFRDWPEQVAAHRIRGNIRRLNNLGISRMNLAKCYLGEANLENVKLSGSELWKSNLSRSDLESGQLDGCDMWSTDFRNSILRSVNLSLSRSDNAQFANADLSDANLASSTLVGADFENANLTNAILDNADLTDATGLEPFQLAKVKSAINAKMDERLFIQTQKLNPKIFA